MTAYGAVFKEFRLNRGWTLQDLADGEVSVAQISRFECGLSDLSVSKFFHILDRLQLTEKEFMDRVRNYQNAEQIDTMSLMAKLHYKNDIAGLERLLQEQEGKFQTDPSNKRAQLNAILMRNALCDLDTNRVMSAEDLAVLSDHLFCREQWEIQELILIGNIHRHYPTAMICRMVDEVVARKDYYLNIGTHKHLVIHTLINVVETLVDRGDIAEAARYDALIPSILTNERNAYHRLLYLYTKGYLKHAQGDARGKEDMEHALQAFDWIGNYHHAQQFRKHFVQHVGEK